MWKSLLLYLSSTLLKRVDTYVWYKLGVTRAWCLVVYRADKSVRGEAVNLTNYSSVLTVHDEYS